MGSLGIFLALLSTGCIQARRTLPTDLDEISGWVVTSDSAAVAINDSGNDGVLWRYSFTTGVAASFGESLPNTDWEAISYDSVTQRYLVCDIGDNRRARQSIGVYLLDRQGDQRRSYTLTYPRESHDCEACLYRGDTLTLITKAKTLKGGKSRQAYVFRALLADQLSTKLELVDSFTLRRRSVTDATWLTGGRVAILAYDFRLLGPFPFAKTTVYTGRLAGFRQNQYRATKVKAPFTLTQYESIALAPDQRNFLLASERTLLFPARWRRLANPLTDEK